ncbi:MAG: hypothetical protein AYL32_000680 [Candidatus Bathyarchaeota archaeon B26-2]|nr:MAG: hypothetical protein AYL32_000680 [Candidatus Bathyarchaeota archaeon B26-2]
MGSMKIAVWGHPYIEFPEGKDSQKEVNSAFSRMAEVGITMYFAFVAVGERLLFKSTLIPKSGKDMLSKLVEAGKTAGVEVHPIIGFGDVSPLYGLFPERVYKVKFKGEPPEWAERAVFKNWLCPSWRENRELTVKVVEELLENYDVDGIHLDYIRYPNARPVSAQYPCVCDACKAQRLEWLGREEIEEEDLKNQGVVYKELSWRNRCVRETVERVKNLTEKRGLKLTMAARAYYLTSAVIEGQDWVSWCKDGLIDIVSPMSYTTQFEVFRNLLEEHLMLLKGCVPLFEGIGRRSSAGVLTPEGMMRQINLAKEKGLPGVTIFHFNALTDRDFELLKNL